MNKKWLIGFLLVVVLIAALIYGAYSAMFLAVRSFVETNLHSYKQVRGTIEQLYLIDDMEFMIPGHKVSVEKTLVKIDFMKSLMTWSPVLNRVFCENVKVTKVEVTKPVKTPNLLINTLECGNVQFVGFQQANFLDYVKETVLEDVHILKSGEFSIKGIMSQTEFLDISSDSVSGLIENNKLTQLHVRLVLDFNKGESLLSQLKSPIQVLNVEVHGQETLYSFGTENGLFYSQWKDEKGQFKRGKFFLKDLSVSDLFELKYPLKFVTLSPKEETGKYDLVFFIRKQKFTVKNTSLQQLFNQKVLAKGYFNGDVLLNLNALMSNSVPLIEIVREAGSEPEFSKDALSHLYLGQPFYVANAKNQKVIKYDVMQLSKSLNARIMKTLPILKSEEFQLYIKELFPEWNHPEGEKDPNLDSNDDSAHSRDAEDVNKGAENNPVDSNPVENNPSSGNTEKDHSVVDEVSTSQGHEEGAPGAIKPEEDAGAVPTENSAELPTEESTYNDQAESLSVDKPEKTTGEDEVESADTQN